jgi:hypothetical protein
VVIKPLVIMDLLTAALLALIVVLAHLLLDTDGGDGGKFSREGAAA